MASAHERVCHSAEPGSDQLVHLRCHGGAESSCCLSCARLFSLPQLYARRSAFIRIWWSPFLKRPLSFFDTNPLTSILNRFSKDIGCMDELLPSVFLGAIQMILFAIAAFLLPVVFNPCVLLIGLPLLVLFVILWGYSLKTARQVRKLEISCRKPVISHFSETLTGLVTIRTHNMQKTFTEEFYRFAIKISL